MYENISYVELKNLPEDQKAEAWGELHSQYSNTELARILGTAPIAVVNAVRKYVFNQPVGRVSKRKEQTQETQNETLQTPQAESVQELLQEPEIKPDLRLLAEVKPKRKYNRKAKPEQVQVLKPEEPVKEVPLEQHQEAKSKRKYNRKSKQDVIVEIPEADIKSEPVNSVDLFAISIKKNVIGEDAQLILSGIGNMLLKGQRYMVEVKIEEI